MRHHFTRFQEDIFKHNMVLVEKVKAMAEKKGVTPAQLALAWVLSCGEHVVPIPGSSYVSPLRCSSLRVDAGVPANIFGAPMNRNQKRNLENIAAMGVELNDAELAEIAKVLEDTPIMGGRYNDAAPPEMLNLWG